MYLESELKLETLVVKLTHLFEITHRKRSYCEEQTVFSPSDIIARAIELQIKYCNFSPKLLISFGCCSPPVVN
jgi:hypothetical protein